LRQRLCSNKLRLGRGGFVRQIFVEGACRHRGGKYTSYGGSWAEYIPQLVAKGLFHCILFFEIYETNTLVAGASVPCPEELSNCVCKTVSKELSKTVSHQKTLREVSENKSVSYSCLTGVTPSFDGYYPKSDGLYPKF